MKAFKIVGLVLVIVAAAVSIWQWHRERAKMNSFMARVDDNESYPHKLMRFRADAEQSAREACTNEVVGLRQIIYLHEDTTDDNFMKWTASATVEFINSVGGVERTNLDFKFGTINGETYWLQK
jgi:hypothetical protein